MIPARRHLLVAGPTAALLVAGLLSLWVVPPSPGALPLVIGQLVLGAGFAAAAPGVLDRARAAGGLFALAAVLLLLAPVGRAAGATDVADVATVLAGAVAIPLGLARVVPRERGRAVLGAVDGAIAGAGLTSTVATAAGAPAVAAGAAVAAGVGFLVTGWIQFELTAGEHRRALLWVVLGVGTSVLTALLFLFAAETSGLGAVPLALLVAAPSLLLPLTAAVAVVAPNAVDVRVVISGVTVYSVMLALVLAVYGGTLAVLALVTGTAAGKGAQGLLVALIAAGFHPTLRRVRAAMDELLFGGRADAVDTLTRLGTDLTAGASPREWLDTLRIGLGVPWLALREDGRVVAESGDHGEHRIEVVTLRTGSTDVGELAVAVPAEQLRLAPATASVLNLVAAPLAQAVHAVRLGEQLQASRREAVVALEEQRRRMRRDLHDGLGPTLTGIAYSADAAANLVRAEPEQAADVLRGLRADAGEAITEIRRIVHGLRPRALDELGLVGAVRQQVGRLRAADGQPLRVVVAAPAELGELPAALEVVAYRVAVEAVTNVARHAGVAQARVALDVREGAVLTVTVTDPGRSTHPWSPGVGLRSMRERVEQVGGTLSVEAGPDGATVAAVLPLRPDGRG
ncbi:MAG: sensor histidine kinase [Pseudonocardia sp.]